MSLPEYSSWRIARIVIGCRVGDGVIVIVGLGVAGGNGVEVGVADGERVVAIPGGLSTLVWVAMAGTGMIGCAA